MGMQRTPLLMSRLIDRGANVAPGTEIVTATERGTRRQTYLETRQRAYQLAHALRDAGIGVGDRVGTFGTGPATWRHTMRRPAWTRCCIP